MENGLESRFAGGTDFGFVYSGRKEIAQVEGFIIPKPEDDEARARKAIDEKRVLLAVLQGKPAGFIWFVVSDVTPFGVDYGDFGVKYAWVDYVFVDNSKRGKGIGKFLYEELAKWCGKNSISEVLCDVYENNPKSVAFHEKLGFKPVLRIYSKKTLTQK